MTHSINDTPPTVAEAVLRDSLEADEVQDWQLLEGVQAEREYWKGRAATGEQRIIELQAAAVERDEWQARAVALLSVLDKAVDMTAAGYAILTHRGSVVIDRRIYEALQTAVEEYRRLSEMEKAAGANGDEATAE